MQIPLFAYEQLCIMEPTYFISIFLDTRRAKSNGKYPVKLRVFTPKPRKQKLYATKFEYTEKEFNSIWQTTKPRTEHKVQRLELLAIETKANEAANKLNSFSFIEFEKRMFRSSGDSDNVYYHYEQKIKSLQANKQLGTASNYDLSLKSIKRFLGSKKGKTPTKLSFYEITPEWLNGYERYMIDTIKSSRTTVGIYLRPLRAIFNTAISDKDIDEAIYPFGKGKYQIPAGKGTKRAISKAQVKALYQAKPLNQQQQKAKDFWLFSYACSGMNIKDIAQLKYGNIKDDKLSYYRAKTINTSKADMKLVEVVLTSIPLAVIKKYGNKDKAPDSYVFPIIDKESDPEKQRALIQNFTRFINQNIKKLAKSIDLPEDISTYWARHSFATIAINSGASIEFVSDSLNHSNLKTTQAYFNGFEDETKRKLTESIVDLS